MVLFSTSPINPPLNPWSPQISWNLWNPWWTPQIYLKSPGCSWDFQIDRFYHSLWGQQNCPLNYFIISSATIATFELSLVVECSSTWMPFKLSYFIELLLNQLMVLWSAVFLGHITDHHQSTHCLPYGTCWWVSGEYHTNYHLFIHPLWVTKFINHHFKLVWLHPVLIINLEDYICYTFSLFLLYY